MMKTPVDLKPGSTPVSESQPLSTQPLRPGVLCPSCGAGKLDFNGVFRLECPQCGFLARNDNDCGCSFRAGPV